MTGKQRQSRIFGSRILIVDDDRNCVQGYGITLESAGASTVDGAFNGREALEKHGAAPYDLILLNVEMPVMDGWDALRQLRAEDKDVGVIMHSVIMHHQEPDWFIGHVHYDEFLRKPFSPNLLLDRVNTVLRITRLRRQQTEATKGAAIALVACPKLTTNAPGRNDVPTPPDTTE